MSVTINWRRISDCGKHFAGGTSTSFDKLKQAFGSRIMPDDIRALRLIAIVTGDSFYEEVADTVEKAGGIEVWDEY